MKYYKQVLAIESLRCISCLLGIIALFVGTKAYKKCKIVDSSLNDRKEFYDSSCDHSQRAAGDIVNNNCDVTALTNLTAANFEASLKQAYSYIEQQAKNNLQQIIENTHQIIQEQKPNIAGLTKIDWINIYFESAKNTSDEYMQNIWAKLLAKELELPGSFSYKTLDVLKNMSADDFKIFEKLCSLEIEGFIFSNISMEHGLSFLDLVKLSENGLLNVGMTQREFKILPHQNQGLLYGDYLIIINNTSEEEIIFHIPVYLLSTVAKELITIINTTANEEYAKDCVIAISKHNKQIGVTLHRINGIEGGMIEYDDEDLCSK